MEEKEIEIDLKKIFGKLKGKIIYIVIFTLFVGLLAGCYTNMFITPQYTASCLLYAYSDNNERIASDGSISSAQIDASEKLINTYLVAVKSDTFLTEVADQYGQNMTVGTLKGMVTCSQYEDTLTFKVSVTSPDPVVASELANIIADKCPETLINVLKVGGVEVIDYASTPTSPSSPNLKKNVTIGLIVGLAVSFAFFFVKELFDTSIVDEKDLQKEFEIPILGTIPKLVPYDENEKAKLEAKHNKSLAKAKQKEDKKAKKGENK